MTFSVSLQFVGSALASERPSDPGPRNPGHESPASVAEAQSAKAGSMSRKLMETPCRGEPGGNSPAYRLRKKPTTGYRGDIRCCREALRRPRKPNERRYDEDVG